MIATRCTVRPSNASLCNIVDLVMGGIKDKYILRENGGDQFVGRYPSCSNMLIKEFAVLPPYFDFSR